MIKPLNVLIVDDEEKAQVLLKILLQDIYPDTHQIYLAGSVTDAIKIIKSNPIDLTLLDIEMPEHSGLDLLNLLPKAYHNFDIIFTTAYSEYAIQAFKINAIDYLLKPINHEALENAVNKVSEKRSTIDIQMRIQRLESFMSGNNHKISIPLAEGNFFLNLNEIIYCHADRMYTEIFTVCDGKFLISRPLKYILDLLPEKHSFFRSHRSYLINTSHIKMYNKADGGSIKMSNGDIVSISRDNKSELAKRLGV